MLASLAIRNDKLGLIHQEKENEARRHLNKVVKYC